MDILDQQLRQAWAVLAWLTGIMPGSLPLQIALLACTAIVVPAALLSLVVNSITAATSIKLWAQDGWRTTRRSRKARS